jgi:hypothetical protein
MSFYIPREWKNNKDIMYLIGHKYDSLDKYNKSLKEVFIPTYNKYGYVNHDRILTEYIRCVLQDILDNNNELYVTKYDITNNEKLKNIIRYEIPDFIIKGNSNRKTTIVDIISIIDIDEDLIELRNETANFAYSCIIDQCNFYIGLAKCGLLSENEAEWFKRNNRLFQIEYGYWISCKNVYEGLLEYPLRPIPEIKFKTHLLNNNKKVESILIDYYGQLNIKQPMN